MALATSDIDESGVTEVKVQHSRAEGALCTHEDVESRMLVASEPLSLRPARSDPGPFYLLRLATTTLGNYE